MRVVLLVLALVLVGASAVAQNICDPNWLRTASGSDVRALIRGGADVNRVCNPIRNQPLHQALLPAGVSPDVGPGARRGGRRHPGREHRRGSATYDMKALIE